MALHYDPIRIKRLAISSSCAKDIILFQDLHLIAQRISFSLASLSDSPLRSCSFYEKGCCTLIPTICVGSVDTATLSIFCMLSEYPGCHGLLFPTIPEYSPSPWSSDRQSLLTLHGSPAQLWIVVRYLDNMWHTIGLCQIGFFLKGLKVSYSVQIALLNKWLNNWHLNTKPSQLVKKKKQQPWTSSLWLKT